MLDVQKTGQSTVSDRIGRFSDRLRGKIGAARLVTEKVRLISFQKSGLFWEDLRQRRGMHCGVRVTGTESAVTDVV